MNRTWFLLALICLLLVDAPAGVFARQENPTPQPAHPGPAGGAPAGSLAILAPMAGAALQGIVTISASAGGENFQAAEIAFAYTSDTTDTWFLIHERNQPLNADTPIEWDTSLITDGDYTLRLLATYMDGSRQSVQVSGLRVRNYTALETNTPAPLASAATTQSPAADMGAATSEAAPPTPQPTQARTTPVIPAPPATPTPPPVPTLTPRNPAALAPGLVWLSAMRGVLAVLGAFSLVGLYELLRRLGRR